MGLLDHRSLALCFLQRCQQQCKQRCTWEDLAYFTWHQHGGTSPFLHTHARKDWHFQQPCSIPVCSKSMFHPLLEFGPHFCTQLAAPYSNWSCYRDASWL